MSNIYSIKVKKILEVPSYIKENCTFNIKKDAFIISGEKLEGSGLQVKEYLAFNDMIFKIIFFPRMKEKSYANSYFTALLEPYCLTSRALDKDMLFSELNGAIMTHEMDFEKIMKYSHKTEDITPATKINYLFLAVQQIISNLDPWGLLSAPIDEYDNLVSKIVSYLAKAENIDFNEVEKMIRDYCMMEYIKGESIVEAINELKHINFKTFI